METSESARAAIEVHAGLIPGQPMEEYTKRVWISSAEWHASEDQANLLCVKQGQAMAWAQYLMMQPDRVNWVKVEWIWF